MKSVFILPSLLLLVACSSTGDAGRVGGSYTNNQYQQMRTSNLVVSSLPQNTTNRLEIVEYAKSVGVVVESNTSTASVDSSRYASSPGTGKPGHSPTASDREQIPVFNKQYNTAIDAFKNMYDISVNGFIYLSPKDAKHAYMMAGGDASKYTWDASMTDADKAEIQAEIQSNITEILDRFFMRDPDNTNKWIFSAKSQNLADIEFQTASGTDTVKFQLSAEGEIIGINIDDTEYNRRNSTGRQFDATDKAETYTDKHVVTVITQGTNAGLKYSDFGYYTKNITRNFHDKTLAQQTIESSINPYSGGYELKNVSRDTVKNLNTEMNFDGIAVGSVSKSSTDSMLIAGNATLNFKDGTETLNMYFATGLNDIQNEGKWYDVKIINDGTNSSITFTPNDAVDEKYQLTNTGTISDYDGFDIKYYGDNNAPNEFVGTATYTDAAVENGVTMNAAFGGTKQ